MDVTYIASSCSTSLVHAIPDRYSGETSSVGTHQYSAAIGNLLLTRNIALSGSCQFWHDSLPHTTYKTPIGLKFCAVMVGGHFVDAITNPCQYLPAPRSSTPCSSGAAEGRVQDGATIPIGTSQNWTSTRSFASQSSLMTRHDIYAEIDLPIPSTLPRALHAGIRCNQPVARQLSDRAWYNEGKDGARRVAEFVDWLLSFSASIEHAMVVQSDQPL